MFAIIKTGGKQYIVHPGDKIKVEKLDMPQDSEVSFDALLVSDKETLVGTPYVVGYKVTAKILGQGKGKKIIVYKYKPKKRYHKKQGHRQLYTEIEIVRIAKGGEKVAKSAKPKTTKKTVTGAKKKVQTAAKKPAKSPAKKGAKSR